MYDGQQIPLPLDTPRDFVTTSEGGRGWFAVHVWWNPEGFYEPYNTGFGRYATKEEAIKEAKELAEEEGLEYRE